MMKILKLSFTVFVLSLFLSLGGYTEEKNNPMEHGFFDDYLYTNSFFGFELLLPEGSYILKDQQNQVLKKISKLAAGDREKLKKQYEEYLDRVAVLLTSFIYPVPKTDGFNPSFSCVAENMKYYPGIKNAEDLLRKYKAMSIHGHVKYSYPDKIDQIELGGVQFHKLVMLAKADVYNVKQEVFVTSLKGYFLKFVVTYDKAEDESKFDSILSSINFKN